MTGKAGNKPHGTALRNRQFRKGAIRTYLTLMVIFSETTGGLKG